MENRLFDRDTLWLSHFDINLLYVMSLYAADDQTEQSTFKEQFKSKVFHATLGLLKSKYTFYSIKPFSQTIEEFVKQNFYLLHGKIYNKPDGTLILALENGYLENDGLLEKLRKVSHVTIFH